MKHKIIFGFGSKISQSHTDKLLYIYPVLLLAVYLCYNITGQKISTGQEQFPKIWASMGLCYSHNTDNYGKKNYPYKEIIPLSLLLWRYHLPQVNTIVRIVYTEPELTDKMRSYGAMLARTGAVVEWIPAGNMSCVTMSQLVRSLYIYLIYSRVYYNQIIQDVCRR